MWFSFRQGRVTASAFKKACITSINNPSLSLIKSICYPAVKSILKISSIDYGVKHEAEARAAYTKFMKKSGIHKNFSIREAGFVISKQSPEFGASADGFVNCQCCGDGCIEIKCPYRMSCKSITLEDFSKLKGCFLKKNADNTFALDRKHEYYFQVQMQMYCAQFDYCDFVTWSKHEMNVERIYEDVTSILPQGSPLSTTCKSITISIGIYMRYIFI